MDISLDLIKQLREMSGAGPGTILATTDNLQN